MRLSTALFLLWLASTAARAQTYEISVLAVYPRMGGAALGSISSENKKDDDTKLRGEYGAGARLTWNTKGYYGHELGYIYNRVKLTTILRTTEGGQTVTRQLQDHVAVQQAFYNFLIYFMPRGEWWRPYMTGGLQMARYGAPGFTEWETGSTRNYGGNFGGGIKFQFFKQHLILRFDVRDYIGGKPYDLHFADESRSGGLYRQLEGSFGIGVGF